MFYFCWLFLKIEWFRKADRFEKKLFVKWFRKKNRRHRFWKIWRRKIDNRHWRSRFAIFFCLRLIWLWWIEMIRCFAQKKNRFMFEFFVDESIYFTSLWHWCQSKIERFVNIDDKMKKTCLNVNVKNCWKRFIWYVKFLIKMSLLKRKIENDENHVSWINEIVISEM